jgi:hypothetical protein
MKEIIYKIKVWNKNENFISLVLRKLFGFKEYIYWIEYRIDENRYWYKEKKNKRVSEHHSKKGKEEAIEIIINIAMRAYNRGYDFKIIFNTCGPNKEDIISDENLAIKSEKFENNFNKKEKKISSLFLD